MTLHGRKILEIDEEGRTNKDTFPGHKRDVTIGVISLNHLHRHRDLLRLLMKHTEASVKGNLSVAYLSLYRDCNGLVVSLL